MRILRIAAVVLFAACLLLNIWATARYNAGIDYEGPVLACDSEILEVSTQEGEDALMRGVTATDAQDGDLTDRILIGSASYFVEPGVFDVEYVVFDSHRNSATLTRRVVYTDYVGPQFRVLAPLVFSRGENIRYLNYVTAYDVLDGDITDKIKVKASNVSNYTAGTYPVLLEVTNSHGDTAEVELNVVVLEGKTGGPKITLGGYTAYVEAGAVFNPYDLIQSVMDSDGNSVAKNQVNVLGTVDTEVPGSYQLIYSYSDSTGEGRTYLTVVVTERED